MRREEERSRPRKNGSRGEGRELEKTREKERDKKGSRLRKKKKYMDLKKYGRGEGETVARNIKETLKPKEIERQGGRGRDTRQERTVGKEK